MPSSLTSHFEKINWKKITLVSFLGLLFDMFNHILSLIDAYSDAAVALEFKQNGRDGFYYACMIVFILGMISNSFHFTLALNANPKKHVDEEDDQEFMNKKRDASSDSIWYRVQYWWRSLPKVAKYIIQIIVFIPFALILPLVNYIYILARHTDYSDNQNMSEKSYWESGALQDDSSSRRRLVTSDASSELLQKYEQDKDSLSAQVDYAIASRQTTLAIINAQCVVESLPQSIIQLIAISLTDGDPTPAQVFSLSLSLFSIAAKTFQLCRSWSFLGFVAKISVLVHDLFSLAFSSSAVFMATVPSETTFFFPFVPGGELEVTKLTWWWLSCKIIAVLLCLFCCSVVYVDDILARSSLDFKSKCKGTLIFVVVLCVFGAIPLFIIQEGLKLSYIFVFGRRFEQYPSMFPNINLLDSFLFDRHITGSSANNKQVVKKNRKRCELIDWSRSFSKFRNDLCEIVPERKALGPRYHFFPDRLDADRCEAKEKYTFERIFARCLVMKNEEERYDHDHDKEETDGPLLRAKYCLFYRLFKRLHRIVDNEAFRVNNEDLITWLSNEQKCFGRARARLFNNPNRGGDKITSWWTMLYELYRLWDPFGRYLQESQRDCKVVSMADDDEGIDTQDITTNNRGVLIIVVVVGTVAFSISGISGLVFPLLHWYWYSSQYWTVIQWVSFVPTILCLVVALVLLPTALRYMFTSFIAKYCNLNDRGKTSIVSIIDLYDSLPVQVVRKVAISNDGVIPSECFDRHVGEFLSSEMVHLHAVGRTEFDKIMNVLATSSAADTAAKEKGEKYW